MFKDPYIRLQVVPVLLVAGLWLAYGALFHAWNWGMWIWPGLWVIIFAYFKLMAPRKCGFRAVIGMTAVWFLGISLLLFIFLIGLWYSSGEIWWPVIHLSLLTLLIEYLWPFPSDTSSDDKRKLKHGHEKTAEVSDTTAADS